MTEKYFNIAGPCNGNDHYILPASMRCRELAKLIRQSQYFVIHSARQSGKTTLIQHLAQEINRAGQSYALYCSLEAASVITDEKEGIPQIFQVIKSSINSSSFPFKESFGAGMDSANYAVQIKDSISGYCKILDRPLIIFFDEIDSLADNTLIALLRQLRDGFITRASIPFPQSIGLVGMRNIRDYKAQIRVGQHTLGSASPFNIIAKSLTLTNFTLEEISALYSQHTKATGQIFEPEAILYINTQTCGQPWLVNAVASEALEIIGDSSLDPVTKDIAAQAVQKIILGRGTHIDSLLERLREDRVRRIIEPIIVGKVNAIDFFNDDTQFCLDMGLIKADNGELKPANLIYNEVIIRWLSGNAQFNMQTVVHNSWVIDGKLDMHGLMRGFQHFWRENSESWIERLDYKEAAPHLLLQAFLQRIINGGGQVLREYAAGRERMDLCVIFGGRKYAVEIKLRYSGQTVSKGIDQLSGYMDTIGESEGWLVVFDRRPGISWDEKIQWGSQQIGGKTIYVVSC
jgi:hypothetical protein